MGTAMDISGIDYLGIDRVLRRGSGEVIAEQDDALLVRDSISEAYMLACKHTTTGISLLDHHVDHRCNLLMISNHSLGMAAFERYGFSERFECYQVAYYREKPSVDAELSVRTATEHDLHMLIQSYRLISPEELEKAVMRGSVLIGYHRDRVVGFIGEHLEGSMGILYVFPEYRRRGFGAALQMHLIAKTMDEGFVPFGQVEKGNEASLRLQERLGMTRSDNLIVWMWR